MADRLTYVYGIVAASFDASGAPSGVDDAPVTLEPEGALAALVSSVEAERYRESELESRVADVGWLAPRATGHDRVVTWASDTDAVVPLPLLSLFRDGASVRAMLSERKEHLSRTLERVAAGREYIVRVFRIDAVLQAGLSAVSDTVASIERDMATASPGQRYLLGRKLEVERAAEMKRVGQRVAAETFTALSGVAIEAVRNPLPAAARAQGVEGGAGSAVLDAAYLVRRDAAEPFRQVLTGLVRQWEDRGFRFEFTGPWPAYHFVRETTHVG